MNSTEYAEKNEVPPALGQQMDSHHPMSFHEAAAEGNFERVKELLAQEADVHQQDEDDQTALHLAAEEGHLEVVKELLKHRANVQQRDIFGLTALCYAAREGHLEVVKELLKYGASVHLPDNGGQTPLHHAARLGKLEAVKELLKHGADIYRVDQVARTLELARYLKLCRLEMTKEHYQPIVWKTNFSLFLSNSTQLQKASATDNLKELTALELLPYTP